MDTSKSPETDDPDWIASADLFSGRPNPSWMIDTDTVRMILGMWESAGQNAGSLPPAPALGYRGVSIRGDGESWRAFGGIVSRNRGGAEESRADINREIERRILAS